MGGMYGGGLYGGYYGYERERRRPYTKVVIKKYYNNRGDDYDEFRRK